MKKLLMTTAMLVVMSAGAMMLSSFTTPKQDSKAESSQIQMNDDNWKVFRQNVAYCDADTDQCNGYGTVYLNTDTKQLAITPQGYNYPYKIDLGEYTAKEGYNMRFWYEGDRKYYYVNLFIPAAAFN
jgi:hypothetical protein